MNLRRNIQDRNEKIIKSIHEIIGQEQVEESILNLLLYRYLSEDLKQFINQKEESHNPSFDYSYLTDEEAKVYKDDLIKEKGFYIPPSLLFENLSVHLAMLDKSEDYSEIIENNLKELEKTSSDKSVFSGLFDNFSHNIKSLGRSKRDNNEIILKLLFEIAHIDLGKDMKNAKEVGQKIARRYLIDVYDDFKNSNVPQRIANLAIRIATDDEEKIKNIFDPYNIDNSFFNEALRIYGDDNIEEGIFTQERLKEFYINNRQNLILTGMNPDHINVAYGDFLNESEGFWDEDKKFEVIVCNPPFSTNLKNKVDLKKMHLNGLLLDTEYTDLSYLYMIQALSNLSEDGTAVFIGALSMLYKGGSDQKCREYLVKNNYIDAIIELAPNIIPASFNSVCLFVLKKNKSDNRIFFINASKFYEKGKSDSHRINKLSNSDVEEILEIYRNKEIINGISCYVDKKRIVAENYNLSVELYTDEDTRLDKKKTKKLKSLVKSVNIGNYRSSSKRVNENNAYLISNNSLDNDLITNTNKLSEVSSHNLRKTLKDGDIIVSRNFNSYKAGLFKAKNVDMPVIADANTFIIRPDTEKVDPLYLLYLLTSDLGKNQLTKRAPDSGRVRTISANMLQNIEVPIIEMERQKEIGKYFLTLLEARKRLENLLESKQKQIAEFPLDEI